MPAYRCADADEIVRTVADAEVRGESVVQVVRTLGTLDPDPRFFRFAASFVVVTRKAEA